MQEEIKLVTEYLDKIAGKLGVGVEKIWPWLVKQQYIEALVAWGVFALFSTGGILLYRSWVKAEKAKTMMDDSPEVVVRIVLSVVVGIGVVISGLCAFCGGFDFLNAEYHAFRDLLRMLPK